MNLLLLLSALLSAFTGLAGGARGVERAATVAERIVPAQAVSRIVIAPRRPIMSTLGLVAIAAAPLTIAPEPLRLVPLFMLRRRE